MRDPDLVLQAQRAASALERAWRRWRYLHGLAADPMPPVSSYVGYSLDEPWGQPRVVFGLAAEEAEQLAVLLERHDCIGPVHAAVGPLTGSRREPARTGHERRLPVPAQAPATEPAPNPRSSDRADYQASEPTQVSPDPNPRSSDRADYQASEPTQVSPDPNPPPGDQSEYRDSQVTQAGPDLGWQRAAAAPPGDSRGSRPDDRAVSRTSQRPQEPPSRAAATGRGGTPDEDVPLFRQTAASARQAAADRAAMAMRHAHESAIREDMERNRARQQAASQAGGHATRALVRDAAARAAALLPPASNPAAYQPQPDRDQTGDDNGPGPLTLAASAARDAAETRIRAALNAERSAVGHSDPRGAAAGPGQHNLPRAAGTGEPAITGPGLLRPEAASGATFIRPVGAAHAFHPEPLGGPADRDMPADAGLDTAPPAVVAFRPRPDLAAYLDEGPEDDPFFSGESGDFPPGSLGGRSRMARGHSLPRPARAHRPDAAPGA